MRPKKRIPKFRSEAEERRFWATHDSTEYLDWSKAERVMFPNLKPSVKTISIRLPESLLNSLKTLANERDVPYQSLVKMILAERIEAAWRPVPAPNRPLTSFKGFLKGMKVGEVREKRDRR